MIDLIFIFSAKYLFIFSPIIVALFFIKNRREIKKGLVIFLSIMIVVYLAGSLARGLYYNPRPFVVGEFEPLIHHVADNGFPSDHILLLSALAVSMMYFSRKTAYWLWGLTILVAISRVYAGVHHLSDVIASVIIAIFCAIILNVIYTYARQRQQ